MNTLELAGRRVAPMMIAALVAAGCNNRDFTSPAANAVVQAPPTEPPGQAERTKLSFRGEVDEVNMEAQTITLTDGRELQFTAETRIPPGSDIQSLSVLSAVAQEPGVTIDAGGYGDIVSQDPLVVAVKQVSFRQEQQ